MQRLVSGTRSPSRFMRMASLGAATYGFLFAIADALVELHLETPSQMLARLILVSAVLLAGLVAIYHLLRREQLAIAAADDSVQVAPPLVPAAPRRERPASRTRPVLSRRELEVASLIARGCTSKAIADALVITERTADTHADHIRAKLGLRSRAEIAAWTINNGYLSDPPG